MVGLLAMNQKEHVPGPWVQPLRSYVQQADPQQLSSEMEPGAADIAELVPWIGVKLPNLKSPPALEPEQARFRLFDSITTFLKSAAPGLAGSSSAGTQIRDAENG